MASIDQKPMSAMTKEQIIDALAEYQRQSPTKYEAKKAELFKRYGLDAVEELPESEEQAELKAVKKRVAKK